MSAQKRSGKSTKAAAGEGIDIMISFDTTGSMYPCAAEVNRKVDRLVRRLHKEVPNIRIGFIRHGDYCDAHTSYVTEMLDLTSNLREMIDWMDETERTGGGDAAECYELVLHEARSAAWRAEKRRILVVIADDVPHGPHYPLNRKRLDWRNEARMLAKAGIQVYAVQCLNFGYADDFYEELAEITGGLHLRLNQFRHVENLLLGIAYKQDSDQALQDFEEEVRSQGPYVYEVEMIFSTLAGRRPRKRRTRADGLIPVDPARFQVFDVEGEPSIRDFVESMGIKFETGRGFYPHITRTETIQEKKEVILEDNATGEMFTGDQAREMIGLPYGERGRLKPNPLPGYTVWVQSTSYNRKLRERAFLYEVPEKAY